MMGKYKEEAVELVQLIILYKNKQLSCLCGMILCIN